MQIEISSDPEYAAGISMAMAFPTQRLLPGMVLTHINGVDQGGVAYQKVLEQLKAFKTERAKLVWALRSELTDASQLMEFDMPYAAIPGDRIRALSPDNMKVEVVYGGDTMAHPGEVYMVLLSRTIPVIKNQKKGFAQTMHELKLIEEIGEIKAAIGNGDASRSVELANMEELMTRVKLRGLKAELKVLRAVQDNFVSGGGERNVEESENERERLRRLRRLEDELLKLQDAGSS
jgi:hypothetical protein